MSRVGHRIATLAKSQGLDPNRLRAIFALERLVARLESDPKLSASLVYKGGFVLVKVIDTDRFTRDLDALAFGLNADEAKNLTFSAVTKDMNDGIAFGDPRAFNLDEVGEYGGLRIDLCFQLDVNSLASQNIAKLSRVHLDIGFGRPLPVKTTKTNLKSTLDDNSFNVSWSVYPLEFIFAEKLQTLVIRGNANSRAKDVYDMWRISQMEVDKVELLSAIKSVFEERSTTIPNDLAEFCRNLDTAILKNSWRTVLFKDAKLTFDEIFRALTNYLGSLK